MKATVPGFAPRAGALYDGPRGLDDAESRVDELIDTNRGVTSCVALGNNRTDGRGTTRAYGSDR